MKKNIIILLLFLLIIFHSCINCQRETEIHREDECNLVVEIPPSQYPNLFKTKGYDPITKVNKICDNENRWWNEYKKEIRKGDTIVKRKGELIFYIHKKDSLIAHEWVCYDADGKHVYPQKK